MTRILAFDIGQKRVGVAISDPIGLTAQPLTVIARKPHAAFLIKVESLVREHDVSVVLLGLPLRTTGEKGPEAQRIMALAHEFKTRLGLNVATWDERMSTVAAERILKEGGLSASERLKVVDKTAAAIILDSYLNYLAGQKADKKS